jgi:hypothetical protein
VATVSQKEIHSGPTIGRIDAFTVAAHVPRQHVSGLQWKNKLVIPEYRRAAEQTDPVMPKVILEPLVVHGGINPDAALLVKDEVRRHRDAVDVMEAGNRINHPVEAPEIRVLEGVRGGGLQYSSEFFSAD